jgi:hypothetical protein
LTQCRKLGLTGKAIVSQNEFMTRWTAFTAGVLNGMNWDNVFCAGGAILASLIADNTGYNSSDIDLFIYGLDSDEAANAKLREIHAMVVRNTGCRGDVIRTARAVTILNTHPYRHVQVVLRAYKTPAEVLLGFDIDSCTVGFDGKNVYCMERFKRALTKRYNLVNISRRSLTYEQRLYKYSRRGFAVAVPNLDKGRVNPEIFQKRIKDLFGLSKLLLYDHLAQMQIARARSAQANPAALVDWRIQGQESSDYNGEFEIPWGPNFSAKSIMHMLSVKDKRQFFSQVHKMKKAASSGGFNSGGSEAQKKPTHLFEKIFFDTTDSQGNAVTKIEWIRNNPAYQDLDGGFTRPLMTGSFQLPPPVQAIWDTDSYSTNQTNVAGLSHDQGYVPGETYVAPQQEQPQKRSVGFVNPDKIKPAATSTSPSSTTTSGPSFVFGSPTTTTTFSSSTMSGPLNPQHHAKATASGGGFMSTGGYEGSTGGGVFGNPVDLSAFGGPSSGISFAATSTSPSKPSTFGGAGSTAPSKFSVIDRPTAKKASVAEEANPAKTKKSPFPAFGATAGTSMGATTTFKAPSSSSSSTHALPTLPAGALGSDGGLSPVAYQLLLNEFASLRHLIAQIQINGPSSSLDHPAGQQDEAPPTTKLLLLVSLTFKQGSITSDEKATLKDLIIERNEAVFGALEVFEIDQDLEELVDTFKRAVKKHNSF